MPTLYILAGPNGAGKTTFYYKAIEEGFINPDLAFVNVDIIARNELGGYTEENFVKAAEIARQRMTIYLKKQEDFMIESNLAKDADYDWIESIRKAGYGVILYFLCTENTEVNIDRVERRVKEGGHYIPPHIITDRYKMGLIYLQSKLHLFKEAYLIDNTNETVKEMAMLTDGKIEKEIKILPEWVKKVLTLVKLLMLKGKS